MAAIFALFYLASFFGQLGVNVTTYVMAAESYPAELRSTLHGLSAFSGDFDKRYFSNVHTSD